MACLRGWLRPSRSFGSGAGHSGAYVQARPGRDAQCLSHHPRVRKFGIRPLRGFGTARRFVERRPLDLARLEDLEDVAFAQIVEAVEQDATLEALGHFTHV